MDSKTAAIAGAIIVAGGLIAGALYFSRTPSSPQDDGRPYAPEKLRPITTEDHRLGPIDAPVSIITFTDLECPFCKVWHETVLKLAETYPKLQIVYRHFPIARHTKASTEAQAAECAAKLAGDEAFWSVMTGIFEVTPSNNGLDLGLIPGIAKKAGVKDMAAFAKCLETGETKARVDRDLAEAIATGGDGTPWSIFVTKSGDQIPIKGARPFETMAPAIEDAIKEAEQSQ